MWTLVVDHAGDAEKELVWSFTKQDFVFVDYTPEKPETKNGEQDGADQPATAPESKPEGNDKPEPEAEGRSR